MHERGYQISAAAANNITSITIIITRITSAADQISKQTENNKGYFFSFLFSLPKFDAYQVIVPCRTTRALTLPATKRKVRFRFRFGLV